MDRAGAGEVRESGGFQAVHYAKDGVHIWLTDTQGKLYQSHTVSYSEWAELTATEIEQRKDEMAGNIYSLRETIA